MKLNDTLVFKIAKDDRAYDVKVVAVVDGAVGVLRNSPLFEGQVAWYTPEFLEDQYEVKDE